MVTDHHHVLVSFANIKKKQKKEEGKKEMRVSF